MKTIVRIELETKKMKMVVPEEYIGCAEECPKDKLMTAETEKDLHDSFVRMFEKDNLTERFEEVAVEDCFVEGCENLGDFGDVRLKVRVERQKKAKRQMKVKGD